MDITPRWPDDSPEGRLALAFIAFAARDGHALAALSSRTSLEAYRTNIHRQTRPYWNTWTAEALRQHQPEMPLEVADWQVRQMSQHRDAHEAQLLQQFAGVRSVDELLGLDAVELLARALRRAPHGSTKLARLPGYVNIHFVGEDALRPDDGASAT